MPTTEDDFHVFVVIKDTKGNEVIGRQLYVVDRDPIPNEYEGKFNFDTAHRLLTLVAMDTEHISLKAVQK